MSSFSDFSLDGTLKFVIHPFVQLFSIHADIGSSTTSTNVVPLVFALLLNKKQATYEILFHMLKARFPNWCPRQFTMDFEMAIQNAAQKVLPNTLISGCYFHFLKSLWKKAKHLELKSRPHKRHVALCASLAHGWLYIMED